MRNESLLNTKSGVSGSEKLLHLLPEDILITEDTNVRPFTGYEEVDQQFLQSLLSEGQLQPIVVSEIPDAPEDAPNYKLIAGRRRVEAIKFYNEQIAEGDEPLTIKAIVKAVSSSGQAFHHAYSENAQRENMSPMDFALNIQKVKSRLAGITNLKLGEFFGTSEATIIQHLQTSGIGTGHPGPRIVRRVEHGWGVCARESPDRATGGSYPGGNQTPN